MYYCTNVYFGFDRQNTAECSWDSEEKRSRGIPMLTKFVCWRIVFIRDSEAAAGLISCVYLFVLMCFSYIHLERINSSHRGTSAGWCTIWISYQNTYTLSPSLFWWYPNPIHSRRRTYRAFSLSRVNENGVNEIFFRLNTLLFRTH